MIEHDKHDPTRLYIQLPGGWEAQTKGKGSSYRLYDAKTDERHMILCADDKRALEFVTRMFVEVHDEYGALRDKLVEAERERDEARAKSKRWEQVRSSVAELRGYGEDWPSHGNAPLAVTAGYALLLRERDTLQAENERLREALTPSAATKAAYMSEFQFKFPVRDENGVERMFTPNVPWTTIKEIMAAILARAVLTPSGTIPPAKPDQDAGAIPSGNKDEPT